MLFENTTATDAPSSLSDDLLDCVSAGYTLEQWRQINKEINKLKEKERQEGK